MLVEADGAADLAVFVQVHLRVFRHAVVVAADRLTATAAAVHGERCCVL